MKRILWLIALLLHSVTFTQEPPQLKIYDIGQKEGHYSSRQSTPIDMLVMHYTAEDLETTFKIFLGDTTPVSSHYIISEQGTLFRNTQEENAARHAGDSYWDGVFGLSANNLTWNLNQSSIGIEHVNMGYRVKDTQPSGIRIVGDDREWYPFEEKQIDASIALSKYIVAKYAIKPENVVGHSDIAPKRKSDPGPLFPWKKLYDAGVGAWPEVAHNDLPCLREAKIGNKVEEWFLSHLFQWGYKSPDNQASSTDIIRTFQMHFRQNDIAGNTDLETAEILSALLYKYKPSYTRCIRCTK